MTRSGSIRTWAGGAALVMAALAGPIHGTPSPAEGVIERLEDGVIAAYAGGKYRLCSELLERMLTAHPSHPVSVLYQGMLFSLADLLGPAAIDAAAGRIRDAVLASGDENAAAAFFRLTCGIESNRYRFDAAKAKEVTDELKPVRRWILYGPYRRYGEGDIDHRFQPEIVPDIRRITPQKRAVVTNSDGWLYPGRYLADDRGVVYAAVSFYAEGAVNVRVFSEASYRAFINGQPVLSNPAGDRRSVRVVRIPHAGGVTVMVKMKNDPAVRLRLLITDERNGSVNPMREDDRVFTGACGATEEQEYPGTQIMDADRESARGDARRGLYFAGLGSDRAIAWYRASLTREKSAHTQYLLASALRLGDGCREGTARADEARLLIGEISSSCPAYAPARQWKLGLLVDRGDYRRAYREGRECVSSSLCDAYASMAFLGLLDRLGRDTEFAECAAQFRKEYAEAPLLLQKEADFYSRRDASARITALAALLKTYFTPEAARSLIRAYRDRGEYGSAHELINSYNFNNDFTRELIGLLVREGNVDQARTVIFKALVSSDDPDLYRSLALIDIAQSDDPSMYLQKLLDGKPSDFGASDYLAYLADGMLVNPFSRYRDAYDGVQSAAGPARTTYPVEVLYRQKVYLLIEDGGSRAYYEDIVRINSEAGARRWSEIRFPFGGDIRPVSVRAYDRNGSHAVSCRVDGGRLLIRPVRKDSILHVSCIVDNAVPLAGKSGFFSMPPDYLQYYDEPVGKVSVRVIAPGNMKLRCAASKGIAVRETVEGALKVYDCGLNDRAAVWDTQAPGGMQGSLPWIAFSTMEGPGDFIAWYNGLLAEADREIGMDAGRFARDGVVPTTEAVYDFVARNIGLEERGIGTPRPAADTLLTKTGSAEDKVLLARTLLGRLGIRSYTAFARSRFLPDPGAVVHHELFSDIVLYVPLDAGNALWLDFSSTGFRCGDTSEAIAGTDAYVVVNDYYRMKKIIRAGQ